MARIRTIKPELWESEKTGRLSPLARLTFIGLISLADDEGRGRAGIGFLMGRLHPYGVGVTPQLLSESLQEIENVGLAQLYDGADGCSFYALPGFKDNQKIDRPSPSKLPAPVKKVQKAPKKTTSKFDESSRALVEPSRAFAVVSGIGREGIGKEGIPIAPSAHEPEIVKPKTPIQRVVEAYKHAKRVPMDDKAWDKSNFGRAAKAAQNLMARFGGDVDKSAAYIFLRAEDLNEKDLDWTLETIARHAHDGMGMPKGEENGQQRSEVGSNRVDGPRRGGWTTPSRAIVGDALRAIESARLRAEGVGELASDGPDFPGDDA